MKKWLVGLMAAGLCVASAWAETVTYTVESTSEVSVSGTAPEGASAEYTSTYSSKYQLTGGNSMTLTLKGYEGATITGLTLSMRSNASKGAGSLNATSDAAVIAAIEDSPFNPGWHDGWSTNYVDVTPSVTETAVTGDIVITIAASANSLYCQSFTIAYEAGEPQFSVTFNKENWFKVALGEASSVTAIPKNGIEPYTFLWDSDTPELKGGTTDTLEIPATLAEGDYTVACLVTEDNGEGDAINALIGFTVEAIPVISGDAFALVTSNDELQDGVRYLVTDVTHSFAMSSAAVGSALSAVEVTETEGVITATDESTIWTLVKGTDGNFALQNGGKYVGWTSGNAATMQDAAFANKISVAEKVATITAVSDSTRNLKYNKSSPRFAYYTSAQTDLALFKEAGEAGLSVSFDKANGFTVDLGTADSITATAKNGTEPYSYVWTSDTPDLNGTGASLAIPATLAAGDYTVQVEVTDSESNKASKQIYFTVAAPLEPHAINIDAGIQNGTVTSDPEGEAVKGTQVKLTATATTEGYALKEMTVTYGETVLTFTASPATFEMPDEAVSVGAIFAEVKDYAELPFVAEDTPYSGPWKGATVDGLTSKGLGNDYTSGGAVGARLDDTGDWLQIKFQGAAGELSYGIKGNSLSEEKPSTFKVQESADGETWADLATFTTGDNLTGSTVGYTNEVSASSQFVRFFYEEKGAGNVGIYDVYISSGGPAVFSITLDPAKYFEVEVGEEASIAATPKNAEGEVHYAWTVGGEPAGSDSAVLGLDTTAATEEIEVVCTATDSADTVATASVSYKVVVPAPKFAVNVALDIQNGTVTTDVPEAAEGDTVTVTATPADGYRLVAIIVNNGDVAVSGNTFVMPAQEVLVTATFEEFEVPPYYFQFETGANIAYAATEAEIDNTGSTKDEVPTVGFSVQRATRGKDAGDKVVGTYALRLAPIGETNAFAYNSKAFAEALTAISFQYGIYGTSDKCDSFTVSTSEDGETWTVLADLSESAATELKTFESSELPANTYFIRFDSTSTVKGNTRRMCIDEIQLFTGAPKPSISYTGDTTVKIPGSFSLQFSVKNYEGTVAWAVTSREGGTISEAGLYTWTPAEATDGITISVSATGEGLDLSKSVTLVVEPKDEPGPGEPTLTCAEGTTIAATVGQELVLHFTLVNAEFSEDDFIGDGTEGYGVISDVTATSFVYTCTPTEATTVTLTFQAINSEYLDVFPPYPVTLNVTEGGGGDAVTVKSYVVNADGSVTVTLSDGSTTSAGLQYSTDLKNWSTTPVNVKTAASAFVRVGAPE